MRGRSPLRARRRGVVDRRLAVRFRPLVLRRVLRYFRRVFFGVEKNMVGILVICVVAQTSINFLTLTDTTGLPDTDPTLPGGIAPLARA